MQLPSRLILFLVVAITSQAWKPSYLWNIIQTKHDNNKALSSSSSSSSFSSSSSSKATTTTPISKAAIPPLLLFLFSTCLPRPCHASALNPQAISISSPFFQGWLVRTTDHKNQRSFIFIIGSFSFKDTRTYSEHYIFCGVDDGNGARGCHVEAFPDPATVTITGSLPLLHSHHRSSSSSSHNNLNVTWSAKGLGSFTFTERLCEADFSLSKDMRIRFKATERKPWSNCASNDGPEGWLGHTSLLPCHYFVHSVGSKCEYTIKLPKYRRYLRGTGYAHIEGNHGAFFPKGWVWAQAVSKDNEASMSLVAGKFDIGGINPVNVVLYLRSSSSSNSSGRSAKRHATRIFRTTDLDRVQLHSIDNKAGVVSLTASSFNCESQVRLDIKAKTSIFEQSFGPPVFIPTATGFSNSPGARETYTATATASCYERDAITKQLVLVDTLIFPLTALEFGASFLQQLL